MIIEQNVIEKTIVPNKLICNSILYNITILNSNYIINEFTIYTNEMKKIEKIIINKGNHPNCDPKTKEFCFPDFIKDNVVNDETIQIIENMFKIFNFDSAFYQPWQDFKIVEDRKNE